MRPVKEILEAMKAKAQADPVAKQLLHDIKSLEQSLGGADISSSPGALKVPYSSMPKLTGRRWK